MISTINQFPDHLENIQAIKLIVHSIDLPDASALESLGYFYLKTEIFPQFKRHHHVIKRVNL